ncbi:hypothetical protein GGX14DRAFT_668153 [Mycena pura]|uniref:Uncharacterized protein n=1 Tax=Mycena pura TaxID=153505 RepID=A0AAD6UXK9_9AGAR|nr:hypothetical protein GGX14DRAFT_668153 [Mycena pura]
MIARTQSKTLLNHFNAISNSTSMHVRVLEDNIALGTRLASMYVFFLVFWLLPELERLDDKLILILTEVPLFESKRATLTSARTSAASIYMRPPLQSALDIQTAHSYFKAFESLVGADGAPVTRVHQRPPYMLLCKVMLNMFIHFVSLLSIKLGLKYAQLRDVESMRAITRARQDCDLADFEKALPDFT